MARLKEPETVKKSEQEPRDGNNNRNKTSSTLEGGADLEKTSHSSSIKYQLRPRSAQARRLCLESEWSFVEGTRHKPRSSPLSRYRRKTANARERYRMRQINTAFESLRGVLPSWVCSRRAAAEMTKIATLRLASAYIRSLQDILDGRIPLDSNPWLVSAILEAPSTQTKATTFACQSPTGEFCHDVSQEELVSLLTGTSTHQPMTQSLDSFCYTTPLGFDEDFFSGCDPLALSSEA